MIDDPYLADDDFAMNWQIYVPALTHDRIISVIAEIRAAGFEDCLKVEIPSIYFHSGWDRSTAQWVRLALSSEPKSVLQPDSQWKRTSPSEALEDLGEINLDLDDFLGRVGNGRPTASAGDNSMQTPGEFCSPDLSRKEGKRIVTLLKRKGFGRTVELLSPRWSLDLHLQTRTVIQLRAALSMDSSPSVREEARSSDEVSRVVYLLDEFLHQGRRYRNEPSVRRLRGLVS